MELFFIVLFVFFLLVSLMSVGVIMGRKPISGSCGGMSALGMEVACDVCGGDKSKCDKESSKSKPEADSALAYDASKTTN
ncbi:MAG: ApbE family protein [Phototrophicales bacterium]|nr:MAG: ApbE family protein [Phototrophicales bacterium]